MLIIFGCKHGWGTPSYLQVSVDYTVCVTVCNAFEYLLYAMAAKQTQCSPY
jgi:hypothetical protein